MRTVSEIQEDLDAAIAARRTALSAQSYSLDTGQGKQMVQRANLKDISELIRQLENELEAAQYSASGQSGILAGNFVRH